MEITRYIIWTTASEDTNEIMSILKPHSSIIISISDVMVCIESTLTNGKIRAYLGDDMEMACIELTDKFIKTLVNTKF